MVPLKATFDRIDFKYYNPETAPEQRYIDVLSMADGKKVAAAEEETLAWLRQILEWQRDMSDNKEFMNFLKSDLDLFSDSVYCFTPNGEVKNLPAGSTPVDFAYNVHTAVGNKMITFSPFWFSAVSTFKSTKSIVCPPKSRIKIKSPFLIISGFTTW